MESIVKYPAQHPLLKQVVQFYVFWRRDKEETGSQLFLPHNVGGFGFTLKGKMLADYNGTFKALPAIGTRNILESPVNLKTEGDFFNVSVRMVPHGLSFFSKVPMNYVLSEDAVSMYELFTEQEFAELVEKLHTCPDDKRRVLLIESFLLKKISVPANHDFNAALKLIHASKGAVNVSNISKRLNVSEKSLNRYFNRYIGVNPITYINLIRFRTVVDGMNRSDNTQDLLQFAFDAGYYDQAHFIKRFKQFSNHTPGDFLFEKDKNRVSDFYNTL